ncbi:hypothetical protein CEXT_570101 [Caerostris extrusa]|uniref:Uncharacterized protein n=1 Tax=Caerostris extrusa TaxID=172846 RepID=A0AAV4P5Z2_CAEEX|nr:hypothetical protein CEXT_570101 [Caerostris extrusa]
MVLPYLKALQISLTSLMTFLLNRIADWTRLTINLLKLTNFLELKNPKDTHVVEDHVVCPQFKDKVFNLSSYYYSARESVVMIGLQATNQRPI